MANRSKTGTDIRREQIVKAALKIIATKGVRGLTTACIAAEVGISEANIYRHFRSKDEILAATVQKIGEGLKRNIGDVLNASSSDSPLKKMKRVFMLHLEYIETNGGIPRLIFSDEMHIGDEHLKQKLLHAINAYVSNIEAIVTEGQKAGSIGKNTSPRTVAMILVGLIQVTTLRWSLSGFSFPLVAEGMKLWDDYEKSLQCEL